MPEPYGYVPVDTDDAGIPRSVLDDPVMHDGTGSAKLLSGELRCTLTALTPLIVGNEHFKARQVNGAEAAGDGSILLPESWQLPCAVAPDKTIIEPLRDEHGRLLIPGTSIKGMLAASIGALLSAPMARVEERTLSYRPNLDFPEPHTTLRREPRPAIVEAWDERTRRLSLRILPSAAMQSVVFVRDNAATRLPDATPWARQGRQVSGVDLVGSRPRLVAAQTKSANLADYLYFQYCGGTDGGGLLAGAFGGARVYHHVLVPEQDVPEEGQPGHVVLSVATDVLRQHEATVAHLADTRSGHLRPEHPLAAHIDTQRVAARITDNIANTRRPGTLIYVEVDVDVQGNPTKVVSYGQNYRYRWREKDSVRRRWTPTEPVERGVVSPHPEERRLLGDESDRHRRPAKLSAVRLLHGYAVDAENAGTTGVGTGDFAQLAGRIAVNMAIEQDADAELRDRFMSERTDFAIPLVVLGAPRASAEMKRLDQSKVTKRGDHGKYVSYGETLDDYAGELGGYVFYRHQPQAARSFFWRGSHRDREADLANVASNQSSIVRFMLKPRRQLRVKIRFRDLRPWELGAVLAALRPTLVEDKDAPLAEPGEPKPRHAVKLGLGRPVGLGSVRIDVDQMLTLETRLAGASNTEHNEGVARIALEAFHERLGAVDPRVSSAFLDLHRYAGANRADYPRDQNGEIFGHFTNLRREHSRLRRKR